MLHFQLAALSGLKFDGEAYEVIVPTQDGTVSLFEDHMPLISAGTPGILYVRKKSTDHDNAMESFAVNGGVVQIDGKTVRFLADEVNASEEISEKAAQEAYAKAEQLMKNATTQTALHEAKRALHHSGAQLQVARLKKRHHQ